MQGGGCNTTELQTSLRFASLVLGNKRGCGLIATSTPNIEVQSCSNGAAKGSCVFKGKSSEIASVAVFRMLCGKSYRMHRNRGQHRRGQHRGGQKHRGAQGAATQGRQHRGRQTGGGNTGATTQGAATQGAATQGAATLRGAQTI